MELRKYQEEAKAGILNGWESGRKRLLLVLPTGTGKTLVFSSVAEELVRRGERVLILAHREELLQQAADKLRGLTGLECAVEKAENTAEDSWFRITVASVQTLMREKRRDRFDRDHYQTIIVDEAHHILANSYQSVLEHFGDARVLGVTATPDRGDKRNLGEIFEDIAYEYTLPRAIKEGFLCKIQAQTIPLRIDLAGVKVQAGDYRVADLGDALEPYLEQIVEEMANHCADRKTVVFLPLIATSQKMCRILNAHGFRAAEINGESEDRAEILRDFTANRYNVLCNSMLLTEGWDEPSVDCIVNLRPTKVRSLYAQMTGRGTRIYPGKKNLLLLDFLWLTQKHELCRPACLIAENEEVAKKVAEILAEEKNAAGMDLEMAVEDGKNEVIKKTENALAAKLAEQRNKKQALVDPLQFEYSIQAEDLINYEPSFPWEMGPPSMSQVIALEKLGISSVDIPNAGIAAKLFDRISKRKEEGLTTAMQIRCLERYKFRHVGTWQFSDAKRVMARIAGNGWRIPAGINPSEYQPKRTQP